MTPPKEEIELSNCITVSRPSNTTNLETATKPRQVKEPKEPKKKATTVKLTESPTEKPKRKRAEKKATKEPDRKILVAVDFGTTFSDLLIREKPDFQSLITQWPEATSDSLEGVSADKVPTEIAYDGKNFKWGFQIEECATRHQWFKLDLDPTQVHQSPLASDYVDSIRAQSDPDAQKLVTDYLTAMREHAERVLRYKLPESALLSTPIEYIITVPAVWSDIAQATTRICADAAGMGAGAALHIISEPEAAAVYALNALDPHRIKVGDTFMLCDAGGGTVDLITYKVSSLKPVLKLAEASPGSGSLCGASFLNRGFQKYLEEKLGNQPEWDEEVMEEAMKRFELVKRQFRGTVGEEFQIPVPGLQDNRDMRIRKSKVIVAGAEIKAIFDPVVKEVLNLVIGQIQAAKRHVKAVVLVGGFGQSAYLRDAIREEVRSRGVEVLQSPNSWTAVVRGALMKGLASTSPAFASVKISGRSARKHYGINSGFRYRPTEHGDSRKVWDACSGFYRTYMMEWFINKGDLVKEDDPIRLDYQRNILVSRGPLKKISTAIYYSADPQDAGAPKYVEDESVTQLVKIEADLSRISEKRIPQTMGADGKVYYKLDYTIRVTYLSAYTKYELIYGGKNYGLVTAEYV